MKQDRRIRFALIVEDHPLVAESLVACVRACDADFEIDVAESLSAALHLLSLRPTPLLIVTDLTLTDATGTEAVRRLREAAPDSAMLVFTALDVPLLREEAKAHGVIDYLIKSTSIQILRERIASVIGTCLPRQHSGRKRAAVLPGMLTPKQLAVLEELVAGRSNKEIAARLDISDETVGSHMKAIFGRLGARNRTEAVVRYLQMLERSDEQIKA